MSRSALDTIRELRIGFERAEKLHMQGNLESIPDILNSGRGLLSEAKRRIEEEIQCKRAVLAK